MKRVAVCDADAMEPEIDHNSIDALSRDESDLDFEKDNSDSDLSSNQELVWAHVTCILLSSDTRICDYRYMKGIFLRSDLVHAPPPSTPIDAPPASPSVERALEDKRAEAEALRVASFRRSSRTSVINSYKNK